MRRGQILDLSRRSSEIGRTRPGLLRRPFGFLDICSSGLVLLVPDGFGNTGVGFAGNASKRRGRSLRFATRLIGGLLRED